MLLFFRKGTGVMRLSSIVKILFSLMDLNSMSYYEYARRSEQKLIENQGQ